MCRLDVAGCLWVASDHECREAMAGVGARVMSGVPLVGLGSGVDAQSALNIIYIMRNETLPAEAVAFRRNRPSSQ